MRKKKLRPGEFYKDLDESKQSAGCGCVGLAVVFILILVVLEILIFVLGARLRSSEISSRLTRPNIETNQNFSKIDTPDAANVVISEAIFCSKLAAVRSNNSLGCKIDREGIMVSGKVNFLSCSNANFQFMPKISDGKLVLELTSVRIGEINMPKILAIGLSRSLQKVIIDNYGGLDSNQLTGVYLQDGIMTLEAKK
jgi:hypothetical protein